MADAMNNLLLPPLCAVRMPGDGRPVVVVRGEPGYCNAPYEGFDPDRYNASLGVTPAQREAMLAGSMFGWHVPGANPAAHANAKAEA